MAELVMLDLAAGPNFVDALQRVWDRGDAVFPLDQRLPKAEADRVIAVARPTSVIAADGEPRRLDRGEPVETGDAVVIATSGTTGTPKAVIHTHASTAQSAAVTSNALGVDPLSDTWLACLPPAHIGGFAVITRALLTDTPLVVHPQFEPAKVDRAATDGTTLVSLVTRALNQVDVGRFRKVLIGGAAPPPDRADHVIATYGMTETGSGCVYDGYPLDGVALRAADSGEIEIRSELLFRAYRTESPDVDPFSADGWFRTGDSGRIESDGRLHIDGRTDDVIISGGEKIWPHRVERILESHPDVVEAAIVGRPDPEWGHRVVACIVPTGIAPALSALRDLVKAELGAWNAPTQLVVCNELPKTALGKVRRADLHNFVENSESDGNYR